MEVSAALQILTRPILGSSMPLLRCASLLGICRLLISISPWVMSKNAITLMVALGSDRAANPIPGLFIVQCLYANS